ncbi:efflux RND transporter periplasmic adaptor subunit [Alteromonas lipotrueiana]|uniref:efflux RND transporter periplasmic adaptor subunit n=1 Tax=Alteromonas lipotrueiana TaxID=2803815 RepID=UPI001C438D7E|nr:efflux RND transporter periplasmic adaptor subunit [Alteromonas lipotrueiana]
MNKNVIIALLAGLGLGALLVAFLNDSPETPVKNEAEKPLYWVAPMDDSYRRDEPGQSPMGMDLVPVYANSNTEQDSTAGTVKISARVENNLGVRTEPVTLGTLKSTIQTVGYVQFDEEQLTHIHSRVSGWIEKLNIKANGQSIEKGDPLYSIYSPELVNAQEEYLLALQSGNQKLRQAAKNKLHALKVSDNSIEALKKSKQVKQQITYVSPQTGVVNALNIREGFYVKPEVTLLSIADLSAIWINAEVFERDAALIEQGQPVVIQVPALPNKEWQGKVDFVYPELDENTRTLTVRIRLDNPDDILKPNMLANVTIEKTASQSAILVPAEAVIRTGQQNRVVVVVGNGQYKSVEVALGQISDEQIAITQGLNKDDVVVTSAQFLIDSESSKASDFKRMEGASSDASVSQRSSEPTNQGHAAPTSQTAAKDKGESVWGQGKITKVMAGHRMVTIDHQPIEAWEWPQMVMDFTVGESVDINALEKGQSLHFEITRLAEGGFEITGVHIMSSDSQPAKAQAKPMAPDHSMH